MAKLSKCDLCAGTFSSVKKGNGKWTRFCSQGCFNMWRVGRPHPHTMPKREGKDAPVPETPTLKTYHFLFMLRRPYFWQKDMYMSATASGGQTYRQVVDDAVKSVLKAFESAGYKKGIVSVVDIKRID